MKKAILALTLGAAMVAAVPTQAREAGGISGGVMGCCFGIRTAAAWNEGKNIEVREWLRIIPIVGIVGAVWNTIDGWNGITTADLRKKAGAEYY